MARLEQKEHDPAIADFDTAMRIHPMEAPPYFWRGLVGAAREGHDQAIADYNEAIRLDPYYVLAYFLTELSFRNRAPTKRQSLEGP